MSSKLLIKKVISIIKAELKNDYPTYEIDGFIRIIFDFYLNYSLILLHLNMNKEISRELFLEIENVVKQLKQKTPIQYILGQTEFYGLKFKLSSNVLIPRVETEELVDWIVSEETKGVDILDIGSGSGCIAITLAKNIDDAKVTAIDISSEALSVVKENAELNKVKLNRWECDILKMSNGFYHKYDVVVSNPPYVTNAEKSEMKKNVLDYEPHLALFVSDDDPLIFYRNIILFAQKNLNKGGRLYFEINENFGEEMIDLFLEYGFVNIELRKDINGKDRMIRGILK
ncbi:MAG: peptide chain release factor N(5)-glutamine methyltransferase [Bacteroidales bacterium]|nr:peptide chain release factor N(5)-glutamine methyltransferase [Bacteroidales bacterium]